MTPEARWAQIVSENPSKAMFCYAIVTVRQKVLFDTLRRSSRIIRAMMDAKPPPKADKTDTARKYFTYITSVPAE